MRVWGLEVMIGNCGQDTWGGMLSRSRWGVLFLGGKGKGVKKKVYVCGVKDDSDTRLLLGIYLFPLLTNGLAKMKTSR